MRAWLGLLLAFLPLEQANALAMRISNISDFTLPNWSLGQPAVAAHIDICIYGINVPGLTSYAITATGSNGFTLQSGSNNLPYQMSWDDGGVGNLGTSSGTALTSGVKLGSQTQFSVLSDSCAVGGPNARLNLNITQADLTAALAGSYTGTVTLLLTSI